MTWKILLLPLAGLLACGNKVSNEAEAEAAYLGLDRAVERGLALGLRGFAGASSANIDPQEEAGEASGTMIITGQVDQGESANKGLRLQMALVDYSDTLDADGEPDILYVTDPDAPPALDISLRDIPDGTLEGTLAGLFDMAGAVQGLVELDLAFSGDIEDDGTGNPTRVDGSTAITGTATSDYGVFEVDLVR